MRNQDFRRHDRHAAQQDDDHGHDGHGHDGHGHGEHGHGEHGHGEHDRHHEDDGRRSRGGRRGYVRGSFPGGPPGFPGASPWEGGPRRRGSRARRGDARAAALALLAEQPLNGYQIIQQIGERSGGVWRPSPGSVYPALQQLQDEGLIQPEPGETGHRGYLLTDSGREYAAAHPDELRAPWDVVSGGAGGAAIEMRTQMGQLAMAAFQVAGAGTDAQQAQARKILADSRKSLYRILADSEDEATTQEK